MFRKMIRKIKLIDQVNKQQIYEKINFNEAQPLSKDLKINLDTLKTVFEDASDIVIREFKIGTEQKIEAFLIMIDGLVDSMAVDDGLLKALMLDGRLTQPSHGINKGNACKFIKECTLSMAKIREVRTMEDTIDAILSGDTALFIDGSDTALIVSARGWEARGVDEPDTEAVVRGPREGFVESLRTNTALIRRKIKSPSLKFEMMKIGRYTKTDICVAYIKGIANEKIVKEVKNRLEGIEIDSVLESGYIESFIEDAPLSPFPTVGNSEKPDIVSGKLLEGRVAILVDGTPFALTVPYLNIEAFQNSEDYYSRPFYASLVRMLRWIAFSTAVFLPGVYVAVTTFHHELLPPSLMISIAHATEGTPFPAAAEALLMQIIYEVLREAGVRLPRPVGQAISIVGALVIGESAVAAGLIGAPMVIIVALTAIASFVVPALSDVNTLARLFLIIMGGIAGLYGIMLGYAGILVHLCSLRSFGVPYTSPIAPATLSDLKDTFIRAPWWMMRTRPRPLGVKNPVRQNSGQMPRYSKGDMDNERKE